MAAMMDSGILEREEDFGLIRPSLIRQLRAILDQYPDDGQILKELLQNAEDAGAATVKFLYDAHEYGCDPRKLHHPGLAQFQGAALYAYNNAVFEEKDWTGIRMLQDSIKEKDPMKVGRFGLGFKSVLHMTDLPSVISGDRLAIIDPHEKYFKFKGQGTTGYSWGLGQRRQEMQQIPHQFEPYQDLFGCSRATFHKGFYGGTLFRFPLRTASSELSENLYSEVKIGELFRTFEADAHLVLVFLKNVEHVELCMRTLNSREPETQFIVRVSPECLQNVRVMRKAFLQSIEPNHWMGAPVTVTYPLFIETLKFAGKQQVQKHMYKYLVCEYYAGGEASVHLKTLTKDPVLAHIPLVGVALPLNEKSQLQEEEMKEDQLENDHCEGQVYCFLPLPVEQKSATGLPVHINGYFSVSQNRRHLKWPTAGQNVKGDKSLLWNHCLLEELVPHAYLELVMSAIRLTHTQPNVVTPDHVFQALPNLVLVDEKWQVVLEPFFSRLFQQDIFFTEKDSGCWVHVRDAIFDCMRETEQTRRLVSRVLLLGGVNLVCVPRHILHALGAFSSFSPETVTPGSVRYVLSCNPDAVGGMSTEQKLVLLAYVLKDEDFPELPGVPLLPLADGTFTTFTGPKIGQPVYLCSENHPQELLPGLDCHLVADILDDLIRRKLTKLAGEGTSQVQPLTKEAVIELLPGVIPQEWRQKRLVMWDSATCASARIPFGWIDTLWNYLRRHFPRDLSKCHGLPILPLTMSADCVKLVPLSLPSSVILSSAIGTELSDGVQGALEELGVHLVTELPDVVQSHAAIVGNYVRLPLPEDLLDAITVAWRTGGRCMETLHALGRLTEDDAKRELRAILAKINPRSLTSDHKQVLLHLPIFETVKTDDGSNVNFVSVSEVSVAAPKPLPQIKIKDKLLDLSSSDSEALGRVLGVKQITVSALLQENVFAAFIQGRIDPEDSPAAMQYVLDNFHFLKREDPSITEQLLHVPFITTDRGKLEKPAQLFDPLPRMLQKMFQGEDVFPTGFYASRNNLMILRQLGLRDESRVNGRDILNSVICIEDMLQDEFKPDSIEEKASAILQHICKHAKLLNEMVNHKALCEWLMDISWVPTTGEKPAMYPGSLQWFKAPLFARPRDIKSMDWFPLVGSIMGLARDRVPLEVAKAFRWDLPPTLPDVVMHQQNVINSYKSKEKALYMAVITSIYEQLSQFDVDIVLEELNKQELSDWLWHGDGFTSCDKISLHRPFADLQPYLYPLPPEIILYEKFFHSCGVREVCDTETLIWILGQINEKHSLKDGEDGNISRDLQLAIDILNHLKKAIDGVDDILQSQILVPIQVDKDHTLRLFPVKECTYCDTEWLRQGFDLMEFNEQDGIIFIHPHIPLSTAEALGVPTLMSRMLHAEELNVTGFGQSEPLTNRLKRLLEDYTDGFAIPKELVQNADDAGATEVSFLYDERTNEDSMKYLIDEGMKECHGPALWVHNNSVFSDGDFENITKLGGATKEEDLDKIGKFGLGFNAVYNITDVPSFISRNYIVIFDPHTTHLGHGIKDRTKPGIKIDMQKNKTLLRKLPDQFRPYNSVFGCNVDGDDASCYPGTLFRLPLRTRHQAARSDISTVHYDRKELTELLQLLVKGAQHLLLFTLNVNTIKLFHLPADGAADTDTSLLFEIHKEPVQILKPLTLSQYGKRPLHSSYEGQNVLKACADYLEEIKKAKKTRKSGQRFTSVPETSVVLKMNSSITEEGRDMLGAVAQNADHYWLVHFSTGQERSLALSVALAEDGHVPLAAVAAPLQKEDTGFVPLAVTDVGSKGLVFCYLPLPVHSGLPVHINGSFAVHSNRRYLCERTEDDKYSSKAEWNEALLEDAVCRAYIHLLQDAQNLHPKDVEVRFYDLWPCLTDVANNMVPLVQKFYGMLVSTPSQPTLFDGFNMVTLEKAVFLESSFASKQDVGKPAMKAIRMRKDQSSVVELPSSVVESFVATGYTDYILQKTYTQLRFYGEIFFPCVGAFPAEIRDPLVVYALDQNSSDLDDLLREYPCIPVSPDGMTLKKPEDLVQPKLYAARLFSPEDGRFPYGEQFIHTNRLASLQRLGMKSNDLSWDDILDRAYVIANLHENDRKVARIRFQHFMLFLDRKLTQDRNMRTQCHDDNYLNEFRATQERLQHVSFLPVLPRPSGYLLPWNGDEYEDDHLLAADEVHLKEHMYILSSTQPILDDDCMTNQVKTFLGLVQKEVPVEHVMAQLEHALAIDPREIKTKESFEHLYKTCYGVYDYLQGICTKDDEVRQWVSVAFKDRKCILVGNEYISPCQLAFSFKSDCSPYLYGIPADMARKFTPFLKTLGVRNTFGVEDYMMSVKELKQKSGSNPLSAHDLDLALKVVGHLNSSMKAQGITAEELEEDYGTVYMPNTKGVLQPSSDLCYNDCPWLSSTQTMNFTHPDITYQASEHLGVRTKRQEALSKHARGIPFGQKERLTTSLKRILNSYPLDHEILKELVQNADDACATEIHFIKDPRFHSDKHVFENTWKPLQGPALCVYNNKPFTKADLQGIQRLGEGSKSQDPNKTGQYGIGFSSVYHLTDAPSLLTGGPELRETLCIFDPHCIYVPGATPAEPGMQFDDIENLRTTFPDVFACYLEDQFEMKDATLFRFPLRSRSMAEKSEVSKTHITVNKLETLLEQFRNEAFEILLFANHIRQISISEIDIVTNQLSNTYTVTAELSKKEEESRHMFYNVVKAAGEDLKSGKISLHQVPKMEVSYQLVISDTMGRQEKWCVTQRLGFDDPMAVAHSVTEAFLKGELALLPRGGAACLMEKRLGGNMEADHRSRKVFCFLPLPIETDLPVHINGHFAMGYENRRHLWTNTEGGFKQEWNDFLCGNVIAPAIVSLLASIRMKGLNAEVTDDLSKVYCSRQILENAMKTYQSYFPSFAENKSQWDILIRSVYQSIAKTQAALLPAIRENPESKKKQQSPLATEWQVSWLPPNGDGNRKAFFSQLEKSDGLEQQNSFFGRFKSLFKTTTPSPEKSDNQILKETLLDCGFKILEATPVVMENFQKSGVEIDYLSPEGVLLFLKSYSSESPMCDVGDLPAKLSETPFRDERTLKIVLRFCQQDACFAEKLSGSPLLMTADNMLRVFNEECPVFCTEYIDLVSECSEQFLHKGVREDLFKECDLKNLKVFQEFDICALSNILHWKLPKEKYFDASSPVGWVKSFTGIPSETWLRKLWTFIRYQVRDITTQKEVEKEAMRHQLAERLKPLESWAVIPVKVQGRCFLMNLCKTADIIDYRRVEYKYYAVRDVLRKLFLPELDFGALNTESTGNADLVRELVTTLEKPLAVLSILHQMYLDASCDITVTKEESEKVLRYFSENISELPEDHETTEKLRDLPFYTTIHGDTIKLSGCLVYTLPAKIPTNDIDVWQSKSGTVFLERNETLHPLYNFLGCATISVMDVYCKFILQHFEYFSSEARMVHLRHVYHQYLKDGAMDPNINQQDKDELMDSLKNLDFIEDQDHTLSPASDFYDPENVLFRVMLPEEKLPPRAGTLFRESEWLDFLRKLGLKSEVSKEMFLEFATQVSHEAKDPSSPGALAKSKVLTEHLLNTNLVDREEVLEAVSEIKFICPEPVSRDLVQLYPQYGNVGDGKLPYVSFKDSLAKTYEKLVWSRAAILPNWADPNKLHQFPEDERLEIMECLQIQKTPPPSVVVSHLQVLCDHFSQYDFSQESVIQTRARRDVFKAIYRYLQEYGMDDDEIKERLDTIPFVLVEGGKVLVEAKCTVLNMYESEEIRPFLYKVPIEFGEFQRLFKHIGASETAIFDQYASILERQHRRTGIDRLTPHELLTAYKAVKGLFGALDSTDAKDIATPCLYLPSEKGRLIDSSKLVFNDSPSFYDRVHDFGLQFLFDLKECGIRYRNLEDMLQQLPARLRPGMLSVFVRETLVEAAKRSITTKGIADHLRSRLKSELFMRAIVRLVRHESHRSGRKLDEQFMYSVLDRLSTISVYAVDKVATHLIYNNRPIVNSEMEKTCFVERIHSSGPDLWNVYIKNGASISQDLLIPLAEVVNTILSGMLHDSVLYLLPILACEEREVNSKLDSLNVRLDHSQSTTRVPTLPSPGVFIPPDLHRTLKWGEVDFKKEEFIGYRETPDDEFIYGVIRDEVWSPSDRTYLVNLGQDQDSQIVPITKIFKFHRP